MLWQGHVGLGCRILGFPIHLGSVLTLCELLVWVSGQPEMLLPKARERGDLEMCPWKIVAVDEQDPCAWQRGMVKGMWSLRWMQEPSWAVRLQTFSGSDLAQNCLLLKQFS